MIRSSEKLEAFEKEMMTDPRVVPTPQEAIRIFEWLWLQACALGSMPPSDYLADLEADLEMARSLNYSQK